jgi:putative OmpL-like beta-barrel porin-2
LKIKNSAWTKIPSIGAFHSASTIGCAAFVKYAFNDNFSLAGRAEYISSTGTIANGAPNLLYGPGSNAWSFTITPTYQQGIFFARAEYSYVGASGTTPGFAMGPTFNDTSQNRLLFETGVIF